MALPGDFVTASPTEPNLASSAEAARAVQAALAALTAGGGRAEDAVIALPDRATHASLLKTAGSRSVRRLRAELIQGLAAGAGSGFPERDGRFRFGTLQTGPLRRRSALGAVSGTLVVRQYEAAAEAAGLRVRWVDAQSLSLLPEWLATADAAVGERMLLLLHQRHFVLVAAAGRRLSGFRMKLRARLDPDPPVLAARRLAEAGTPGIQVWGDGAIEVAEALRSAGHPPREVRETGEGEDRASVSPVTGRALAALLRRIGARPAPLSATPARAAPSAD